MWTQKGESPLYIVIDNNTQFMLHQFIYQWL